MHYEINNLPLSVRAKNALKRNNIFKVKQLLEIRTPGKLLRKRWIGDKTVKEILKAIKKSQKV